MSQHSVDNAILLSSLPDLSIPHFLAPVIVLAATAARQRLTIILFSQLFNSKTGNSPPISRTKQWDDIQQLLTFVYVQATKVAQDMDKILLDITVLLKGTEDALTADITGEADVFRISGGTNVELRVSLH
jgi:pantetheine-phosphate adenylyltransferase